MALLPLNKIPNVAKSTINIGQIKLKNNSISGDHVDGGTITHFKSTGIKDKATTEQLTVKDGVIEVAKDLHIKGTVKVEKLEYVSAQVPKLNVTKAIMVDHNEVLWKDRLGKSITKSNINELGILKIYKSEILFTWQMVELVLIQRLRLRIFLLMPTDMKL